MKKGLSLFIALFAVLFCGSISYAQKTIHYDPKDLGMRYCILNGVKYELGEAIKKFGNSGTAVKGCCKITNGCKSGYISLLDGEIYYLGTIAAKYNHYEALQYLVEVHDCLYEIWPVNVKTLEEDRTYTPLMYAIKNGNVKMVSYLLKKGAKVRIQNKWGETPSSLAKEKGNSEIISLLSSYASVDDSEKKSINFRNQILDLKYGDHSETFAGFKSLIDLKNNI